MSILIKNGHVITASDDYFGDIFIEKEQITHIGANLNMPADLVIDARKNIVLPGGVDVHVHNSEPFMGTLSSDDFFSGTIAAACGGTTTTIDYAYQTRGQPLVKALDDWMEKAEGKAVIDYGFHISIIDGDPKFIDEIPALVRQGVTSFKVYTAYKKDMGLNDDWILRILQKCGQENALLNVHCESGEMIEVLEAQFLQQGKTDPIYLALSRPPVTESESTRRVIDLARLAEAPVYIVHLSAKEALEQVMAARDLGQEVFSETCPHYLVLTQEEYDKPDFGGAKYACAPPLREQYHHEALWNGLRNGSIQVVASDHCTFNFKEQRQVGRNDFTKIPLGVPDIETRLYLLWDRGVRTGKISPNRFVDLTATTPAKIFGLFPQKGTIAVGSDADLVIWDENKDFTLSMATMHSNMDYCMYEGVRVKGAPETVLSKGKVIVLDNVFIGQPGDGRFIKRKPFS